ncbi:RNA polymerase II subunit A C-terminal domain phosphatase SSU72 [Colletotrichum spaethianum]|uniref:RNA polymerase II subunit A C-terminal domain phosphatase n=1 Tax=Colletotrichum spaethianum TaxID=700344 RepID=A0AA37PE03_9PEZI|nr:RNA polymerase II subunit A C-terminal domain phosphatase SSU72 [Colletotrichum spaethianum]GKT50467.1 RNA polymerase II subunit A C-terminal domain phosphatase SSU72 [Colletotrichum spaethianum]
MGKLLSLGARLRYPITVTKLLKSPGDTIKKQESILEYSYKSMREFGDPIAGETWQEEVTTIAGWDSPAEGTLKEWRLKEGMTIARDAPCMLVEEACSHEIQFQGLCAICGKDMTEVNWASDQRDTQRATINMTHDQTGLMVSGDLAARAEHETQKRLLRQRKLSLVVDLDQTIIHACIEPTVGEWMEDPSNPNYEAVKDVKRFQLNDEGPRGMVTSGCWYYIKMRPGLAEFLEKVAELYELHVYTMGTRAYALNIAKIVDPQQKLFGNRVISRDENGSMISKSLQRLFPVNTNMVVIIDDRADVWPNNRPNLIKVVPYDFFKGIGDINSSFLPKRQDILPAPPEPEAKPAPEAPKPVETKPEETQPNGKVSALDELVKMSSGDDKVLQAAQTGEQEKLLEQQIKERPLLHMQEELDKQDEQKEKATQDAEDGPHIMTVQHRSQVLRDDDAELIYLQQHLTELHQKFYEEYDEKRAAAPAHSAPRKKPGDENIDLAAVPDVGYVLDTMKASTLQGTTIVLSGLVPLGVDVLQSEIGIQAMSFGAQISTRVSKKVTHLVISTSRPRTQKVRQAAKIPSIKIVSQNWLSDCLSQWQHVDETPYLVEVHPADRRHHAASETTDADTVSDVDGDDLSRPHLTIIDETGEHRILEEDEDASDEDDGDQDGDDDNLMPDFEDGQTSPIDDLKTFDWEGVDDEMKEFLGSDDDSSDADTESHSGDTEAGDEPPPSSQDSANSFAGGGTKRKAADDDTASDEGGSALSKKQRVAKSRGASKLSSVRTPNAEDNESSSLPTPQVTGDEEDVSLVPDGGAVDGGDDFDEDDLEADLEAELAAAGDD